MQRSLTARLLVAGAALALTAAPAFAQADEDPQDSFTGFYVGVSGGAAVQNNDNDDIVVFDTNGDGEFDNVVRTPFGGTTNAFGPRAAPLTSGGFCNGAPVADRLSRGCTDDKDDEEYAIKVGYDQQFGNWVAGVLLEGSMTDATDFTTAFSTTPASYAFARSLDYAISARGRLGWTPGGGGMFYITGGPAYAKLDHDFASTNTANFGGTPTPVARPVAGVQRGGNSVWGAQFGGGAEFGLTSGIGIALEYLYSKYDDEDYFVFIPPNTSVTPGAAVNPFGPNGTNFRPSEQDFDYHSFRASLLYRFR